MPGPAHQLRSLQSAVRPHLPHGSASRVALVIAGAPGSRAPGLRSWSTWPRTSRASEADERRDGRAIGVPLRVGTDAYRRCPRSHRSPQVQQQPPPSQAGRSQVGDLHAFRRDRGLQADNGRYPTAAEGLAALLVRPPNAPSWRGPYLAYDMLTDPWGNPYVYRNPGKHNSNGFDVFSMGPDGRVDGGDDISNWP
jgi:type II secretion system protein G